MGIILKREVKGIILVMSRIRSDFGITTLYILLNSTPVTLVILDRTYLPLM